MYPGAKSVAGSTLNQNEIVPLHSCGEKATFRSARKKTALVFFTVKCNAPP